MSDSGSIRVHTPLSAEDATVNDVTLDEKKDMQASKEVLDTAPEIQVGVNDHPDGGLRAWMVVFGVRQFLLFIRFMADNRSRRCVPLLQREHPIQYRACHLSSSHYIDSDAFHCCRFGFVNSWGVLRLIPSFTVYALNISYRSSNPTTSRRC